MEKEASLSTVVNKQVKKAAQAFCKAKGIKLRYLVEQALVEYLEDEIDLQAYQSRKSEEIIPLKDILAELRS